jgi:uncharacterized protein YqeY
MAEAETLQQMKADMKAAMKAREKVKLQTIRTLLSSLKNASIDKKGDLDEDDIISVLSTEAKKRREAMDAYSEGGREELAEQEETELRVIEEYLPPQMSDEEAEALVDEAIEKTGASSKADMGKVMGVVMPKVKGVYDGSKVKDIVLGKL